MAWPFGSTSQNKEELIKAGAAALLEFEQQIAQLTTEKDSSMRRQVEIWTVANSDSNQGLETEYKDAAKNVAYNVKKVMCLEEHIKRVRLSIFHAKNGEFDQIKSVLNVSDPCSAVIPDVPNILFKPAPQPTL